MRSRVPSDPIANVIRGRATGDAWRHNAHRGRRRRRCGEPEPAKPVTTIATAQSRRCRGWMR